jgi:hypothetical protein
MGGQHMRGDAAWLIGERRASGERNEQAPRFGCRQGILSIRQDGDRRNAGPDHNRRS